MCSAKETVLVEPERSRYGWIIRPTTKMIESHEQARKNQNLALCSIEDCNESLHVEHNCNENFNVEHNEKLTIWTTQLHCKPGW